MGVLYTMEKMGSSQNGHTTSVCHFVTENPSSTIASISQSKLYVYLLCGVTALATSPACCEINLERPIRMNLCLFYVERRTIT